MKNYKPNHDLMLYIINHPHVPAKAIAIDTGCSLYRVYDAYTYLNIPRGGVTCT